VVAKEAAVEADVVVEDAIAIKVQIRRVSLHTQDPLPLPKAMTDGSSGCDLMADIETPITLQSFERQLIPTGIAISIPKGFEAQIRPRSGLAIKNGITLLNTPGTIDSDYRGEIKVILANLGKEPFTIQRGDRIAQMVFQKVCDVEWEPTEILDETHRGAGGFGHTGYEQGQSS